MPSAKTALEKSATKTPAHGSFVSPYTAQEWWTLGASRARVIGQLFVEALVLAAVPTAVGLIAIILIFGPITGASLNPARAFGRPITTDGSVPAEIVSEAVKIEGSPEKVAKLYGVPLLAVRDAVAFQQQLAA